MLAAVHHLPHAVIVCDLTLPAAPILGVNAAFELLTGYKLAECVGRNCRFLQGVDTDEVAIERIRVAIRSQQPCHVTLLNYRKDGCPIHVLLSLKPIFDAEGHCRLMVGSLSEVLENFAAMKVQLRHADRVHKLAIIRSESNGWEKHLHTETMARKIPSIYKTEPGGKVNKTIQPILFTKTERIPQ